MNNNAKIYIDSNGKAKIINEKTNKWELLTSIENIEGGVGKCILGTGGDLIGGAWGGTATGVGYRAITATQLE